MKQPLLLSYLIFFIFDRTINNTTHQMALYSSNNLSSLKYSNTLLNSLFQCLVYIYHTFLSFQVIYASISVPMVVDWAMPASFYTLHPTSYQQQTHNSLQILTGLTFTDCTLIYLYIIIIILLLLFFIWWSVILYYSILIHSFVTINRLIVTH